MYDVGCKRHKSDINRNRGLQYPDNSASGGSRLYPSFQHKPYDREQKLDVYNDNLDVARIGNLNGTNCLENTDSSASRLSNRIWVFKIKNIGDSLLENSTSFKGSLYVDHIWFLICLRYS
ncbi:hypothetical protein KP509_24G069900 [Ceratopteris richardii]|uniref:Uncharacterized protein n=1 Tax=Ceratopteris richardii TaxID=49495 RepID=A0A8T2RYU2_CERRI|nr:hypothetical protein KP509_24G069900 [Ceratopteris richardii]